MSSQLDESVGLLEALIVPGSEGHDRKPALPVIQPVVRRLVHTDPVLMWSKNLGGGVCHVNQPMVDYTGRTLKDFVDLGWQDLIHPDDYDEVVATSSNACAVAASYQVRHRLRRADGEYRWVLVQAAPELDSEERVIRYIGLSTELSLPPSFHKAEGVAAGYSREVDPTKLSERLSARERTIVLMMGQGLSNKSIARKLNISPETVKWYAKSIFLKLTVRSRAEAVYRAAALGFI